MMVEFVHQVCRSCLFDVKTTKEISLFNTPAKLIQKVILFTLPLVTVKFLKVRMGLV